MFGFRKRHNESTYRVFKKAFTYYQRVSPKCADDDQFTDALNFLTALFMFILRDGKKIIPNWHDFMYDEKTLSYCLTNAYEDAGYTAEEYVQYWKLISTEIEQRQSA